MSFLTRPHYPQNTLVTDFQGTLYLVQSAVSVYCMVFGLFRVQRTLSLEGHVAMEFFHMNFMFCFFTVLEPQTSFVWNGGRMSVANI